uniref:CR-type domain-containing protein n=1 Tax=Panagrolaimus sp. ES5 TaxID=591445 RepID=A0AC34G2Y7_9BILA
MDSDLFDLLRGGGGGHGGGMFGGIFGGHERHQQRKGQPTVQPLNVTLEDLYKGKTTKLELTKKVICKTCNGAGGKNGKSSKCNKCEGHGALMETRMVGPGLMQQCEKACSKCHGKGTTIAEKDKCDACSGDQTLTEQKDIEVNITPGMRDGQKIVFRNEGDQEPGIEAGDIVLELESALPAKPKAHPRGEEVSLHEYDERRYGGGSRREAYHGEEDDEMHECHGGVGGPGECAQQ